MASQGEVAVSFRECMFIKKHGMSQGLDLKTHPNGWVSGWISDRNKRLRNRWFMTYLFTGLISKLLVISSQRGHYTGPPLASMDPQKGGTPFYRDLSVR